MKDHFSLPASLTTAILFHQLFEGLSLGIRIASLPPKHIDSHLTVEDAESLLSTPPVAPLLPPTPTVRNFDSDPGAHSISTSQARHSLISDISNSRTIAQEIEVQPRNSYSRTLREREVHWLNPILSFLFAVMTPFGMGAGMTLWKERDGSDTSLFLSLYYALAYFANLACTL